MENSNFKRSNFTNVLQSSVITRRFSNTSKMCAWKVTNCIRLSPLPKSALLYKQQT